MFILEDACYHSDDSHAVVNIWYAYQSSLITDDKYVINLHYLAYL